MKLDRADIPVATILLHPDEPHPAWAFIRHWAAFEVIYTALAARAGVRPSFALRQNGTLETRKEGKIKVARTNVPSQRQQIDLAFEHMDAGLRHSLIVHPSTAFFAGRKPTWQGSVVESDGFGQRLNGVIDISQTVDARYPVWSPLSTPLYRQYTRQGGDGKTQAILARQILDLLCTIRHNLTQGGDRQDEESGTEVLSRALPWLQRIVSDLMIEM
ncbi:MAG: hypothetical protein JXM73_22065 [Anaerolineae bacterium]|nr:hypothetical protein [Anaerolineae bacterium]